jgi:ATP-dependent helicase/nuclease subunit A
LDHSKALERRPRAFVSSETKDIDVRLLGQAVHILIAKLDLSRPVTIQDVENTKKELVGNGFIDTEVADKIDADSIVNFFQTDLGRIVFKPGSEVFREWPFTFSISASELPELAHEHRLSAVDLSKAEVTSDEPRVTGHEPRVSSHESRVTSDEIVVQGMIDMLIRTNSGLFIIDFKTDNITADRCVERAKFYQTQLVLYAMAANAVFGLKVLKKCLYFLKPSRLVEVG